MKVIKKVSDNSLVSIVESGNNLSLLDPAEYLVSEELSPEEKEQILDMQIRPERNRRLLESDARWIEKSSKSESLTALNAYKQALRDFPESLDLDEIEYLDQVVWPVEGE
jgi:hypothetical protein